MTTATEPKLKKIIVEVDPALHRALRLISIDHETTMAAILRKALWEHIAANYPEQAERKSA